MSNFIKKTSERHPKMMLTITLTIFLLSLLFMYLNQENEQIDWMLGFIVGFTAVVIFTPLQTLFKRRFN